MQSLAAARMSTTVFVRPHMVQCASQQRLVLRPIAKRFQDQCCSHTFTESTRLNNTFVRRCYRDSNTQSTEITGNAQEASRTQVTVPAQAMTKTTEQVLAELQSLLDVVSADYHPFCCGGVCLLPKEKAFQLSVGQAITADVLTRLISELHVVNLTSDNPLASVEDTEMADMLTSISDYTQYMLGQGQPVALIPTEVHVHTGSTTSHYPVPPKKSAVPGTTIGSVVLALPSAHSETQLEVKWTTGLTHTLDLPETTPDENKVQWVAYNGSCSHSVVPVTSGQLVTATYNIVRPETYSGTAFSPVCLVSEFEDEEPTSMYYRGPRAKGIADEVLKMLVDKVQQVQASGISSELGVMLSKRYKIDELHPKSLKGGDRLVWNALSEVWKCKLHSVLEDASELQKKVAPPPSEGEEPQLVAMYEVEDAEAVQGAKGGKLVVSSDGCFSPGVLLASEKVVEKGVVDEFAFRPAVLMVNLDAKRS